jgi:hypothetical protein
VQPSGAPSDLGRGDHFGDASLGVAGEQRPDVLPHPRSANLTSDAVRVLRGREVEDQDQVCVVDPRETRCERACIDHELHPLPRRLNGRIGHRFAQTEVVDDNVQLVDVIACSAYLLRSIIPARWPRRLRLHLAQRPFHRSEVHDVSDVAPFLARKEPDRFSAPASIDRCFCRTRMPAVALPFALALDER